MLQNELKAMLNEEECIGVPADEECRREPTDMLRYRPRNQWHPYEHRLDHSREYIDEARRGNQRRWTDERLASSVHWAASFASAASNAIGEQLIFGKLLRILQIFESVVFFRLWWWLIRYWPANTA